MKYKESQWLYFLLKNRIAKGEVFLCNTYPDGTASYNLRYTSFKGEERVTKQREEELFLTVDDLCADLKKDAVVRYPKPESRTTEHDQP